MHILSEEGIRIYTRAIYSYAAVESSLVSIYYINTGVYGKEMDITLKVIFTPTHA